MITGLMMQGQLDAVNTEQAEVGYLRCNNTSLDGGECVAGKRMFETSINGNNYNCHQGGTYSNGVQHAVYLLRPNGGLVFTASFDSNGPIGYSGNILGQAVGVGFFEYTRGGTKAFTCSGWGPAQVRFANTLRLAGGNSNWLDGSKWAYRSAASIPSSCFTVGSTNSSGSFTITKG